MDTVGKRLKHTRNQLRYSLEDFAALGGVGKSTQDRYERDERAPNADYFNLIVAKDQRIDMFWIMSGKKFGDTELEPNAPIQEPITGNEFQLLKNFRISAEDDQNYLLAEAEKCANKKFMAVATFKAANNGQSMVKLGTSPKQKPTPKGIKK